MRHGSLFSGIGGFDLAAEWAGWENVFHCEINPFGRKILNYYWPESVSYEDIKKTDFTIWRGKCDIISGGFPCQPYSQAGKRLGKEDDRHLWPEMLRAIREIKPRWVVGENVRGLINWNEGVVFEEVCLDLENEGYEVQPYLLPAAGVSAPHRRDRIWFVAYCNSGQCKQSNEEIQTRRDTTAFSGEEFTAHSDNTGTGKRLRTNGNGKAKDNRRSGQSQSKPWEDGIDGAAAYTDGTGVRQDNREGKSRLLNKEIATEWRSFPTVSPVRGRNDGFPERLDNITIPKWRSETIKGYGNAVVPQLVYQIFQAINQYETQKNAKT